MSRMKKYFLDDFSSVCAQNGKEAIIRLLASDVLGEEQYEKLTLRYYDMSRNFDCVTEDAKNKPHSNYTDCALWEFTPSIMPHSRNGKCYSDTTAVPIAITHTNFKDTRSKFIKDYHLDGAVVGLDLPTWFNLSSSRRVMIIVQDPLRNPKWYHECNAAICSSPFGLHSREHRDSGRGGLRMMLLIKALINNGYGVYFTDAYKYYLCGWNETEKKKFKVPLTKDHRILMAYHDILLKEIEIVHSNLIVTMGNASKNAVNAILDERYFDILHLPHFSGAAQGRIIHSKEYSDYKAVIGISKDDNSIESQAKIFAYAIQHNKKF